MISRDLLQPSQRGPALVQRAPHQVPPFSPSQHHHHLHGIHDRNVNLTARFGVSARGRFRVFTCFGLEERHGFLLSNPSPRRRRSVALQLLDADAVCFSKPVPGSATNGLGVGSAYSHVLDLKGAMDFLLSNPSPGADGASPSNFWMGARSAFRNPFRVPLRTSSSLRVGWRGRKPTTPTWGGWEFCRNGRRANRGRESAR